jgi:hypothetical protein
MSVMEILAYSPNDVQEFIDFSINGKPDGQGGFETDDQGGRKIGVLRWLHGRQVTEARFFSTPPNHPMKLFMALVERPEAEFVPWMKLIPGIEEMVQIDGLIGEINNSPPIGDLLAAVVPNQQLDDAFEQGRANLQEVLKRIDGDPTILSMGKDDLSRAFVKGTNVQEVLAEVQSKLGISL